MQKAGNREQRSPQQADRQLLQNGASPIPVFLVLALLIFGAGLLFGRQGSLSRSPTQTTASPASYFWITGSPELEDGLYRFSEDELQNSSLGKSLLAAAANGSNPESPVQAVSADGTMFHPDRLPPVVANVFFQPIPINRAPLDVLVSLPGIGPVLAERIVARRKAHGPFGKMEELQQVAGIGPKKYAALAGRIVLD
jgi:competence ComEA-like helix-hairpin-helix protein